MPEVREYVVTGSVQGVGFRWTAKRIADSLGISGWVRNNPDGSVGLALAAADGEIDEFMDRLGQEMGGCIAEVRTREAGSGSVPDSFTIVR